MSKERNKFEKDLKLFLKLLSERRVTFCSEPLWVVDSSPRDKDMCTTCLFRGWLSEESTKNIDGEVVKYFSITSSGWAVLHNDEYWKKGSIITCSIALVSIVIELLFPLSILGF